MAAIFVPMPGFLNNLSTGSKNEGLALNFVANGVFNVEGKLKDKLSAMDVLKATFPAGTVSGAPKVRAMEIINELESTKRGVYSGAVG